jgi:hypothetical protein
MDVVLAWKGAEEVAFPGADGFPDRAEFPRPLPTGFTGERALD